MEFNFPHVEGKGIGRLIPQASPEVVDLIEKMLIYSPDHRINAS